MMLPCSDIHIERQQAVQEIKIALQMSAVPSCTRKVKGCTMLDGLSGYCQKWKARKVSSKKATAVVLQQLNNTQWHNPGVNASSTA